MKIIDLKNKNVFISGATGDIGTEISKKLAMLNCNLILCGSNEQKLKNLSTSLNHKKNTINIIAGDLNDVSDIERIAKDAQSICNIDILYLICKNLFLLVSFRNFYNFFYKVVFYRNYKVFFAIEINFHFDL